MMTCSNNTPCKVFCKSMKNKKVMPIFYSRTILQTFLICIILIFPKGFSGRTRYSFCDISPTVSSWNVCLIFKPLKLSYKIWSSSWTLVNAYTVVDLETISTIHYLLNKQIVDSQEKPNIVLSYSWHWWSLSTVQNSPVQRRSGSVWELHRAPKAYLSCTGNDPACCGTPAQLPTPQSPLE